MRGAGTELNAVLAAYEDDRVPVIVFDEAFTVYYPNKSFTTSCDYQISELAHIAGQPGKEKSGTVFYEKAEIDITWQLLDGGYYALLKIYPEVHSSFMEPPENDLFKSIYESSRKATLVVNKSLEIVAMNGKYASIVFEYYREVIRPGDSVARLFKGAQLRRIKKYLARAFAGETVKYERELNVKDKTVSCELTYEPVYSGNNIAHVMVAVEDVTEARAGIEELEKIAAIAQTNMTCSLICNSAGEIEWVNKAFEELSGYTLAEVKGMVPGNFLKGEDSDMVTVTRIDSKVQERQSFIEEVLNYRKDGSSFWVRIYVTPYQDKKTQAFWHVIIAHDISDEIAIKNKLVAENAQREAILEAIPDLIYRLRADGTFLDFKANNPDDLILPESSIIGMNFFDLPESGDVQKKIWDKVQEVLRTGKMQVVEYERKNIHGKWQFYEARISKSGVDQTIYLVRNITERKKQENEIILAKERAEELTRLKSNFLANISHEIRTPLNGILGLAEIIESSDDLKEIREMVYYQKESGRRLLDTLTNILHLSRLEAEKDKSVMHAIEVNNLLTKLAGIYSVHAIHKQIGFSFKPAREKIYVQAEETMLYQVFNNILANALKFTSHGKVLVTVSIEKLHLQEEVWVCVSDTGIGISKEFQQYIFDSFQQESQGIGRNYEGNGVGLAIAKKYISLMGGSIHFSSTKGVGTDFTIKIPIHSRD